MEKHVGIKWDKVALSGPVSYISFQKGQKGCAWNVYWWIPVYTASRTLFVEEDLYKIC